MILPTMSDRDPSRGDEGKGGRPRPPRPVGTGQRSAPKPPSARDSDGRGKGKAERTKPTPVRAMAAVEAPPPPTDPDLEEAEVSIGEITWLVRVVGRSGGAECSATPLLLLGFWKADAPEGEREREALVVGRTLRDLTPAALRRAFRRSVPPPEPKEETGGGRGRGGRGRGPRRSRRGR